LPCKSSPASFYPPLRPFWKRCSRPSSPPPSPPTATNPSATTAGQVAHLIGDATGAGEGLLNWLASALGETALTPFKITHRSKAQLGVDFLALVETNRFKYWQEETEFDDA
jgi:hypothetical protein